MDVLLKWGKEIWASNPSTSVKSVDKNIEVEYVNWKKQHESFKLSKSGLKFTNTLKAFYKPAAKPVAFSLTEAIDNPIGLRNKSATKMVKRMTPFEIAFKFKPKIVKYKTLAELKVEKLANSGKQKNLKPNEIDSFRLFKLSYPQFVFSPYTLTVLPKTNFITANIDPVVNHNFSILKYLFSDFISYKRFKYISAFEFTTTRYRWGHSIMWVSPPIKIDSYMLPENALPKGGLRLLEVDNRLILPINTNIRVLVTSTDVIHSWSIPSLGIKLDAVPGRLNQTALFIKRTGVFYGQCSELCGINHGFMPIVVEAVSTRDFNKWVLEMSNPRRLEDLVNSSDWQVRVTKRFY
jgi:heme/copper-type cytochrome/quinol oxidase subunit 2